MPTPSLELGAAYVYGNVGLDQSADTKGVAYVYSGDINTDDPAPFVLGAAPHRARVGNEATVFVRGVDSIPGTNGSVLQGQDSYGDWIDLEHTRWELVAPSANAYNADRTISKDMSVVDVSHVEIDIDIPLWAQPPEYPVRIFVSGIPDPTTGVLCGEAGEGGTVTLTTPVDTVIYSIDFLSYGTPTGACGAYVISGCHATKDYSSAIGTNSISVPMTNANFGDPCGGTAKRGYLQITYGPAP